MTPPNPENALLRDRRQRQHQRGVDRLATQAACRPARSRSTYDIKSVSRNAIKQPVMVFRMPAGRNAPSPFNTAGAQRVRDCGTTSWASPSAYFVFSVPQDGIAAPADFNASTSGYLRNIWNGTAIGWGAGTLTGPDASGYYTATLTGVTYPDNA